MDLHWEKKKYLDLNWSYQGTGEKWTRDNPKELTGFTFKTICSCYNGNMLEKYCWCPAVGQSKMAPSEVWKKIL